MSITQIENDKLFNIYPNPSKNIINIENSNFEKIEKISINDITGKIILETDGSKSQLNIENLKVGLYFINISSNGKNTSVKIIKE